MPHAISSRFSLSFLLALPVLTLGLRAQTSELPALRVAVLSDAAAPTSNSLDSLIVGELNALLDSRFELDLAVSYTAQEAERVVAAAERAYAASDIVVASGLVTSRHLLQLTEHAKPSIAAVVIDGLLPTGRDTTQPGSGIRNLTWVESPFDIERDLRTLAEIEPYERLAILISPELATSEATLNTFLRKHTVGAYSLITAGEDAQATLAALPEGTDAVYALPAGADVSVETTGELYAGLAASGLPVFALVDQPDLQLGAYAAYAASDDIAKLPRRVALDVLKLTDGRDAAELPTALTKSVSQLIINMETVRRTGIYPNFELLAGAAVLNANAIPDADTLTLEAAILEGLASNLNLKAAGYDVVLAGADAGLAKAQLYPQANVGSSFTMIDPQTAASSFGQQGLYNWTGQATATQVVLSEPAFAAVTIQRLLVAAQRASLASSSLDLVLEITDAYLGMLQARAQADLRGENLAQTRTNYAFAKSKATVGESGQTDVYRWESELALGRIQVNDALAQFEATRYNVNQLLNRDIEREYLLPESMGADSLATLVAATVLPLVVNADDLQTLGDFLVEEALAALPTLQQLDLSIQASERQALSRKRANFIPQLNLRGQYDYNIGNYKTTALPPELGDFGLGGANPSRWNVGLSLSFPILTGGARRLETQRAEVQVLQARTQRGAAENQLETRLRSELANSVAAYRNVAQAGQAARSARANYEIVQDLYRQGIGNVTSLVDAQNVALQSEINARTISYQFVADFVGLQRATGSYQFLSSAQEQRDFVDRFQTFQVNR